MAEPDVALLRADPSEEWRQGWPVVVAAFAAMFTVFGIAYSFGAFFDAMAAEFHTGRGATSAIFSLTGFLYFTLGAVSGPATDRFGPARVLLLGAASLAVGLLITSRAPWFWLAWISYALGVGIATACGYVPMVTAVAGRFSNARTLAVGISVTGIGVGTLLIPPLAARLIDAHGWRAGYLAFAIIGAAVLVAAALTSRGRAVTVPRGGGVRSVISTGPFFLLYVAGIFTSVALFIAFVHVAPFARHEGVSSQAAAYLISVIGGGSIVGRIGLGAVAGRAGAMRTFQVAVVLLAVSFLIWLLVPAYPGLVAFTVLLGLAYGAWVALSPSVMVEIFGPAGLGGTVGALYTAAGLGALAGPWVAGALVDVTGSYVPAIVGAAVLAFASAGLTLAVRPGMYSRGVEVADGNR